MAIQSVTTAFTCINLLALLVIFFLAFTRIIHRGAQSVASVVQGGYDAMFPLVIVFALLFLALLAFPFMTLYCLIRHKKFPPDYEYVLNRRLRDFTWEGDFGRQGQLLCHFYKRHRDKLWKKLKQNKFLGIPISFAYFTTHVVIVLALLFLAIIALPFMMPYCFIRYKKFPPNYSHALCRHLGSTWDWRRERTRGIYEGDFGRIGIALYHSYKNHWNELKGTKCRPWKKLEKNKFLGQPISFLYFTSHLVIMLALPFLALLSLPFMTLYCFIRYKVFPPDYERVLYRKRALGRGMWMVITHEGDFGKFGVVMYRSYQIHRTKLTSKIIHCWKGIHGFLATKFGGPLKSIENSLWRPAVPVAISPPAP